MYINAEIKLRLDSGKRAFDLGVEFSSTDRFTVLFGPSGAGKSLTLKCLAGVLRPDSGRITVGGKVLFDSSNGINVPARERRLGCIFQDYALFPHLSVAGNIGFVFERDFLGRLSREETDRVAEMLDVFELKNMAGALPSELSGGQRQRVALARALAGRPDAILLDEPFSALDAVLREKMRNELKSVQALYDIPVVMITHDPADVHAFPGTLVEYAAGVVRKTQPSENNFSHAGTEALCGG